MPIVKEVPKPCIHAAKPNVDRYGIGTIWECDNCRRRFILNNDQRDGNYWEEQWTGRL